MLVTPMQVAAFLGRPGDPDTIALAGEHLPIVTAMVSAYTRGQGFLDGVPGDDLAAVVVTAVCRLLANPEQLGYDVGGVGYRGGFVGWSLAELAVLNTHRRRAA